jgi:hypothetical protein
MVVTPLRFTGWCRAVSKVVKNSRQDVRSPAKALGHSAAVEVKGAKKLAVGCGESRDCEGGEESLG